MAQTLWNHPVSDVRAGDLWTGSADVEVDTSATLTDDGLYRITGRIVRGYGKAKKVRAWVFHPDQKLDIERNA